MGGGGITRPLHLLVLPLESQSVDDERELVNSAYDPISPHERKRKVSANFSHRPHSKWAWPERGNVHLLGRLPRSVPCFGLEPDQQRVGVLSV